MNGLQQNSPLASDQRAINQQNNIVITFNKDMDIIEEIQNEVEKPRLKFVVASELMKKGSIEMPKLMNPFIQKVGIGAVVGSSDTGKSFFLRQLALAVATGQSEFLGYELNTIHQSAIYVCTEDDENSVASLLLMYNKSAKMSNDDYGQLRFVFDTENLLQNLEMMLSKQKADLVVIDAFGDLYGGQMNEGNKVRQYLNDFTQLAQKHKCMIMFLHHCGKRTEDYAPNKSSVIGSQSFEAKMRLVIELRKDFNDPDCRHLCIVKGNYLPSDFKQKSYVLHFDDNLIFSNTGKRIPFELLAKPSEGNNERHELCKDLKDLIEGGLSQNEAAKQLSISKGQASKIMKEFKGVSKSVSDRNDIETATY